MKYCSILILLVFSLPSLFCQSLEGLTGIRDTSYTTRHAYSKQVKKFPHIKIVEEFSINGVKETKDLTFCSVNDRHLKLDVFEPNENKKNIAIIIIHGGGWRTGHRSQHYPLAQKLASKGYVCFTPEYRLSTEALFPAAVYDIKAAIRWVRSNADLYGIDAEKIVVAGFSAGGELAAFMGTTGNMPLFEGVNCEPDSRSHVNAVVDIDGILSFVHPESGEGDDRKKTSAATNWFGYPKNEMFKLWEMASPLTFVGKKSAPILFLNSSQARMHAGRDDFIKILDQYKIYSEVHDFEDSPHDFCLFHPWFYDVVNKIDGFLLKVF
jgi:pectinesterase